MTLTEADLAKPVLEIDDAMLQKLLAQFGTHHMSRANHARYGRFVPAGIGLCNDTDEYCFELTDQMVAYVGKQGWRADMLTYAASASMRASWWVSRVLAQIAASILFLRPMKLESALTRDGVGLQFTMRKPKNAE